MCSQDPSGVIRCRKHGLSSRVIPCVDFVQLTPNLYLRWIRRGELSGARVVLKVLLRQMQFENFAPGRPVAI